MIAREVDAHVGERMRERRMLLGVSQGQLGHHLGLTFSQVQKYENGTNRISGGRLYLLASILDVPVQYFFEGLQESEATSSSNGSCMADDALADAFLSIADSDIRQLVLALVCSLGGSGTRGGTQSKARLLLERSGEGAAHRVRLPASYRPRGRR